MAHSTSNRGFAAMDDAKQRAIAAMGGRASGGNFKYNPARASAAGKKSGGNFANDRDKARAAGRKSRLHASATAH